MTDQLRNPVFVEVLKTVEQAGVIAAPWRYDSGTCDVYRQIDTDEYAYAAEHVAAPEGRLIVLLRNATPEMVAVLEAAQGLYSSFGSHSSHWDPTGQHGGGCPQCEIEQDARENYRLALAALNAKAQEPLT